MSQPRVVLVGPPGARPPPPRPLTDIPIVHAPSVVDGNVVFLYPPRNELPLIFGKSHFPQKKSYVSTAQTINQALNYINQTLNYINQTLVYRIRQRKSTLRAAQPTLQRRGANSFRQPRCSTRGLTKRAPPPRGRGGGGAETGGSGGPRQSNRLSAADGILPLEEFLPFFPNCRPKSVRTSQ